MQSRVLVTGGAGSIGSEIVRQLSKSKDVKKIFVLDNCEIKLFNLKQEFSRSKKLRFLLGDVRDKNRLEEVCETVDDIYHCAALKHVHEGEYCPQEFVKTNIGGTSNVIDVALRNGVKHVVNISTDKAVNPTTVMGMTKALSERLISWAALSRKKAPIFCNVRFGNVAGSTGSVIPLFKKQLNRGRITVTDLRMDRYIMSIKDAVKLVLKAKEIAKGGETFVLRMPVVTMSTIVSAFNQKYNAKAKFIGKRPFEKFSEELLTDDEKGKAVTVGDLIIIQPETIFDGVYNYKYRGMKKYRDEKKRLLTIEEFKRMI